MRLENPPIRSPHTSISAADLSDSIFGSSRRIEVDWVLGARTNKRTLQTQLKL